MGNSVCSDVPVRVSVDLSDIRAEVPRTLYGSGFEDVNHEIYGGLDAQRLYDESFEETQPCVPEPQFARHVRGKVCGHSGYNWFDLPEAEASSRL